MIIYPEEKEIIALREGKSAPELYKVHMTIRTLIGERNHARKLVARFHPLSISETSCDYCEENAVVEALIKSWGIPRE